MSDQTSTLLIKLLSTGDLSALEKAKEHSEDLLHSVEGLKEGLELLGVGLSFAGLLEGMKASVEYGASLEHLSAQAGISTDAFQQLTYAAIDGGVKQEELSSVLNVLQRNMAQAAEGATKQNRAISDLGLATAELLAMPVEDRVQAIARAYVNSANKGKAWADVTALLGRNSAQFKQVLVELGSEAGLAGVKMGKIISDEDIKRMDEGEKVLSRMVKSFYAAGVGATADFARFMDKVNEFQFFQSKKTEHDALFPKKEEAGEGSAEHGDHRSRVAAIQAELEATISATPEMIAAHQALAKAVAEVGKAYETPTEAAKRLREEALSLHVQANALGERKTDAGAQLESVKLRTEAMRLLSEANAEDLRADKEKSQYDAAEAEMAQRMAQAATRLLPINEQLATARQHESELTTRLNALDTKSLTYRQDHLKVESDILRVKEEIAALVEKATTAEVEQMARDQEMNTRRQAIALSAVEHDMNLTDNEKWSEKRDILQRAVAQQELYIANMKRIAANADLPQSARDKAANAAASAQNAVASDKEQMGGLGPDPLSFTQNFSAELTKLQNQWGSLQQNMAHGLTGTISSGVSTVSRELAKATMGAQSFGQAIRNAALDIEETLIQAIIEMGVQWIAGATARLIFGSAAKKADTETTAEAAFAAAELWATPAAMASVASYGAADLAGMAGLTAAILEAHGMATGGFEGGGYTGGREGRFAGIVHGEEFVWSAPAVRAIGAGNLERAHQAALSGGMGVASGSSASGASATIINAFSAEDVARSQRKYVGAQIVRAGGRVPIARVAL